MPTLPLKFYYYCGGLWLVNVVSFRMIVNIIKQLYLYLVYYFAFLKFS